MITVLMATYNGEKYLQAQLDSVLQQTLPVRLIVSDDGSTDGTLSLLVAYQALYPQRIEVIHNTGRHGAAYNFLHAAIAYKDDYVMFADQDDVWFADKVERTLAFMRAQEEKYGSAAPLLVYTDMTVVAEDLSVIEPSFQRMMHADFGRDRLNQVLVQNTAAGCSCMYNRALAELLTVEPPYTVMHDWWLLLIAVCFGHVAALEEPTTYYRQHGNNAMGAKRVTALSYKTDRFLHGGREIHKAMGETYTQAESFLKVFGGRLTAAQNDLIAAYADIPKHGKLKRIWSFYKLGAWKNGKARRAAQIWYG